MTKMSHCHQQIHRSMGFSKTGQFRSVLSLWYYLKTLFETAHDLGKDKRAVGVETLDSTAWRGREQDIGPPRG